MSLFKLHNTTQSTGTSKPRFGWAHCLALATAMLIAPHGCGGDEDTSTNWQLVGDNLPGALISVWGTSESDVWAVGGDSRDGTGPLVLHYDGTTWEKLSTGETSGNLWWVFGFENGTVYMGGEGGTILRYQDGAFTKQTTPGTGTIYGIWGASPDDVWAVGNTNATSGGFAWKLSGDAWVDEPSLPANIVSDFGVWKVHGCSASDAYLVGTDGLTLHWDGTALSPVDIGVSTSLFNVHCLDGKVVAVGGLVSGVIVEYDGTSWNLTSPENAPSLTGVFMSPDGTGYATGQFGAVFEYKGGVWQDADIGYFFDETLHGTWTDPSGGMWAVGGQILALPFTDGLIVHGGDSVGTGGL